MLKSKNKNLFLKIVTKNKLEVDSYDSLEELLVEWVVRRRDGEWCFRGAGDDEDDDGEETWRAEDLQKEY